jgi:hypothetical protein
VREFGFGIAIFCVIMHDKSTWTEGSIGIDRGNTLVIDHKSVENFTSVFESDDTGIEVGGRSVLIYE